MSTYGSIRCRLAQMEVRPGRPIENTRRIIEHIRSAASERIDMIVFPEMSVPGHFASDDWDCVSFLRECESCNEEIRESSKGITAIFGSVGIDWSRKNRDGRVRKYNALYAAENGRFISPRNSIYPFAIKTLVSKSSESGMSRYFHDLQIFAQEQQQPVSDFLQPIPTRLGIVGAALCENLWDDDYHIVSSMNDIVRHGARLLINCSSSPFLLGTNAERHRSYSACAAEYKIPIVYLNNVGILDNGKTIFTFNGSSLVYDSGGRCIASCPAFKESIITVEIPLDSSSSSGSSVPSITDDISSVCSALVFGTERFMEMCGINRVCIGISGGIDSSVVASLYRLMLPPENLLLLNIPSRYNSSTTRTLARELAKRLGCLYAEIPIEESSQLTISQIDGLLCKSLDDRLKTTLSLSGVARENIQARDRTSRILAAVAAAFGGVFTCNGNKSEITVGYSTLYGDLGGFLANIGDLWKMEVYELGRYLNSSVYSEPVIPEGSFDIMPSAELSEAQNVDEGKGDPIIYPYHDLLFKLWVESPERPGPEEILEWYSKGELETRIGYKGRISEILPTPAAFISDLERWWTLYKGMAVAKRIQAPPILAVKKRPFGFERPETQTGATYTRRYMETKNKMLLMNCLGL